MSEERASVAELIERASVAYAAREKERAAGGRWRLTFGRGDDGARPVTFERMAAGASGHWAKVRTTAREEGWAPRYLEHASGWSIYLDAFFRVPFVRWVERFRDAPWILPGDLAELETFLERVKRDE